LCSQLANEVCHYASFGSCSGLIAAIVINHSADPLFTDGCPGRLSTLLVLRTVSRRLDVPRESHSLTLWCPSRSRSGSRALLTMACHARAGASLQPSGRLRASHRSGISSFGACLYINKTFVSFPCSDHSQPPLLSTSHRSALSFLSSKLLQAYFERIIILRYLASTLS
jgi:hypothetical protein